MSFAIHDLTVIEGASMTVRNNATLLIEGDRIAGIHDAPSSAALNSIDGSSLIACPGFVNAHTHIGDIVVKEAGFGLDSWAVVMPPAGVKVRLLAQALDTDLVASVRDAVGRMLASGTTTFADFREGGKHGLELLARACEGTGIRSIPFGRHSQHPPHQAEDLELNRGGLSAGLAAELLETLESVPGWSVPLAFDVTDEGLRQTAELVRQQDKLLATHAVETNRYREISRRRFGESDVERIVGLLRPDHIVHMTSGTDQEFDLVAAAGIPVVVAPRMQSVMGIGLPPVDRMVKAGVTVALGSDNGMLASPNLLKEMEFLSRATRASRRDPSFPSPELLLQMATINGAKALRLDHSIGSLEAGKLADIVFFNRQSPNLRPVMNPLATIVNRAEASDVECVMVAGKIVAGKLNKSPDSREEQHEVSQP